jgi:hypothetical protein
VKRLRAVLVTAFLVMIVLSGVATVSAISAHPAQPSAPARPNLSCTGTRHTYNTSTFRDVGDASVSVTVYMQWIEDPVTHGYCGSIQPFASMTDIEGCTPTNGGEPMVAAYTQLYTSGGAYLGGYSWSGNATWTCSQGTWWFYGPIIPVACGTAVHPYGAWLEAIGNGLETDFGSPHYADGEDVGGYAPTHTICVN